MYETFPFVPTNVSNVFTAFFSTDLLQVQRSLIFVVWSNSLYQHENTDHRPLSRWLDSVTSPTHCLKV